MVQVPTREDGQRTLVLMHVLTSDTSPFKTERTTLQALVLSASARLTLLMLKSLDQPQIADQQAMDGKT
jgi:hypothetical protein